MKKREKNNDSSSWWLKSQHFHFVCYCGWSNFRRKLTRRNSAESQAADNAPHFPACLPPHCQVVKMPAESYSCCMRWLSVCLWVDVRSVEWAFASCSWTAIGAGKDPTLDRCGGARRFLSRWCLNPVKPAYDPRLSDVRLGSSQRVMDAMLPEDLVLVTNSPVASTESTTGVRCWYITIITPVADTLCLLQMF